MAKSSSTVVTIATQEGDDKRGRIKRASGLVDEVYAVLHADIMSLRIPPDTRISIDNLARELGVSQTPIREALSMLEGVGLVSKRHLAGYCTAPKLTRSQFNKLYEMRLLVEPYAARCAVERMSDADLQDLAALAHQMHPGVTRASYDRFAEQDSEFHEKLAQGSGNDLIVDALARLRAHMHIFRLCFQHDITTEAFEEHEQVMQALQQRRPADAEAAMRSHLEKSYDRLARFAEG